MNRDDIDIMWNKALGQAIKNGEQFTRYHFAALVAAAEQKKWQDQAIVDIHEAVLEEREACAKVCDEMESQYWRSTEDQNNFTPVDCADAIRARGQA